ncbi:MAG TPA: YihY/virulence factor BrkB family protein [Candidatus Rubrimentiphilum sp.]|nr:YihY/virulence factor BrkB family protein [Candidatus Rubrimentiphilum sp.]
MLALLKKTYEGFSRHKSSWLAAAMAYYTIFAVAPLIIVVVAIAGLAIGNNAAARNEIYAYISQHAAGSAGNAIRGMVDATLSQRHQGIIAQIIGWIVFFLGAIGLFASLRDALNTVWEVEPERKGLWRIVCEQATSFFAMLGVALLLLISVVVTTGLTGAADTLARISPIVPLIAKILDFVLSAGVLTLAFALLFRILPDANVQWRDVWIGALLTAILFTVGQFLLGWYLGRTGTTSTFGAAGSLVLFLLWVNYSTQIVLLGAEFTHVYSRREPASAQAQAL